MTRYLHDRTRAPSLRLALVAALLAAYPSSLQAQRLPAPVLPPPRARTLALDLRPKPTVDPRGAATASTAWRRWDAWPLVIEGAIVGAVIGGSLEARGHRTSAGAVAKGAGGGALIGGAVGLGLYALERWLGRPERKPKPSPA